MNKTQDLIYHLRNKGIILNYVEGNIEVSHVDDLNIDVLEINLIKENRQELINYLVSISAQQADMSIPAVMPDQDYPLSASQKRLWILSQSERSSVAYNMPFHKELDGQYDIESFKKSFLSVIERHEILRTVFVVADMDMARQKILTTDELNFNLHYEDFSNKENPSTLIEEYFKVDSFKPFDLENGPLLRAALFKKSNEKYVFYFNMHHIICDGWSLDVLVKDLLTYYNAYIKKESPFLIRLKNQYKDYCVWQNNKMEKGDFDQYKKFWIETIPKIQQVIDLPTNKIRPGVMTYTGYSLLANLPTPLVNDLKSFLAKQEISLFMGLLASWNILIHRYTSLKDIIIGSPVAGRSHSSLEEQIGLYINTILLRNEIIPEEPVIDFFKRVKQSVLNTFANQEYPFDKLVDDLNVKSNPSRNKLFDVLLVLQQSGDESINKKSGPDLIIEDKGERKAKLDIEIVFYNKPGGLSFEIIFNSAVYEKEMIERLIYHYVQLLNKLLIDPTIEVANIDFLNEREKQQLLVDFNGKKISYPPQKTIIDLYKEQLEVNKLNVAVVFENKKLTYQELDKLSDKLAYYLLNTYSIQKNNLIGIELYRSEWMQIGILAILKCGAAYLPIDPDYPAHRKEYIKEDSKYIACINEKEIALFLDAKIPDDFSFNFLSMEPQDLAYVIYTSGSTGNPKGVLVDHAGLYNRLLWTKDDLEVTEKDIILQKTPFTFDVSVWEFTLPLITGCKLVFAKPNGHKDPDYLQETISKEKISILHFVPSMLGAFLIDVNTEKCLSIKHLICSGETLPLQMVEKFKQVLPFIAIHNYYGPTEASIDVTAINLSEVKKLGNFISIGAPVPNTNIYIVNENNILQPIGIIGELLIGGIQVAQGYLNRADLTLQKFIESPFFKGERIYKTGDLARWSPDGTIEYIGRKDNQVKLRGNRIELGEIENAFQQSNLIDQTIVIVKNDKEGNQWLVAYIVPKEGYDKNSLSAFLTNRLPVYMVPSFIIELLEVPVTSNGKVNISALPEIDFQDLSSKKYVAPKNKIEKDLIKIWIGILKQSEIGIHDNFFELGGDSIVSIRIISKINKHFHVHLRVDDLYHNQRISELAIVVKERKKNPLNVNTNRLAVEERIDKLKKNVLTTLSNSKAVEDVYPMSDIQQGMVYSSLINTSTGIYHDQFVYTIPSIDEVIFEKALNWMIKKHSILRTAFHLYDFDQPIQVVYKKIAAKINCIDITAIESSKQEQHIKEYVEKERERGFVFKDAPLWRCSIFKINVHNDVFVFQFHHAILDGWSNASFNTELFKLYKDLKNNEVVKLKKLKFDNRESIVHEILEKEKKSNIDFWRNELLDYKRLDIFSQTRTTDNYFKKYEIGFLEKIKLKTSQDKITLHSVLLGAYVFAIKMLTYEDDIVIGFVSNNRPVVEDGDKILGCFLNTLPIRIGLSDTDALTWIQYFKSINEKLLQMKSHDRMTLPEISRIVEKRVDDRNPFFDVIFDFIDFHIYDEFEASSTEKDEYRFLKDQSFEATNTFLDLTLSATDGFLNFDYKLSRMLKSSISLERLHGYVDKLLKCYLDQPTLLISTTAILADDEKLELMEIATVSEELVYKETSVTSIFSKRIKEIPDNIAVVFEDKKFTYKELDTLSNQFAQYLKSDYGVVAGDLVGIMLRRDEWLIISIISVIKLGAAYVPIDINFPKERKEYISENSNYKIGIDKEKINLFSEKQSTFSSQELAVEILPSHSLYVIYTSGTTGKPKGVVITHQNLISFLPNLETKFQFQGLKIAATTNITFDISVLEILGALCNGKQLHLFSDEDLNDPFVLMDKFKKAEIELLQLTPSRLLQLYETQLSFPTSLKTLLVGGEQMDVSLFNKLKGETFDTINVYGPTETTIWSSCSLINGSHSLNIGKPLVNERIYILNSAYALQAKGVEGEICIGGAGVAKEYLNNKKLTEEKFNIDPFIKNEKLYKTGDIGKYLPDGNILFLGRKDDQVKIHGHRIELAEIKAVLLEHPQINKAIVLTEKLSAYDSLIAYYTLKEKGLELDLRNYLKEKLPVYMIPSHFIQLEEFPLSSTGKIDRKALPAVNSEDRVRKEYLAPRNELDHKLVVIWQEVLGIEKMGITDNFYELGGHSLNAITIINKIIKDLKIEISLSDFLFTSDIQSISNLIEEKEWLNSSVNFKNEMVI